MRCQDSKQHHVTFHELYSVSSLLCIAQNVRFEIPYKVLYFETPFLMIFKYYAWASSGHMTTKLSNSPGELLERVHHLAQCSCSVQQNSLFIKGYCSIPYIDWTEIRAFVVAVAVGVVVVVVADRGKKSREQLSNEYTYEQARLGKIQNLSMQGITLFLVLYLMDV